MQNRTSNLSRILSSGEYSSTSDILFGLGVVLLVFGNAVAGGHHWNAAGLALIVFSSLVHLD